MQESEKEDILEVPQEKRDNKKWMIFVIIGIITIILIALFMLFIFYFFGDNIPSGNLTNNNSGNAGNNESNLPAPNATDINGANATINNTANITTCTPDIDCSYYYDLKQCGSNLSDGCNNSLNCLSCSNGDCVNGNCVTNCTPNCAGKQCGDNGCGVSCGSCVAGEYCNKNMQCIKGDIWYARPLGGNYSSENGKSYESAWNGLGSINWSMIKPGDTLYIAGTHIYGTHFSIPQNVMNVSGTEEAPVTIRGDYPGDSGVIIGARKIAASSWTNLGDGSYNISWIWSTGGVWQGDPTGNPQLLKPVASAEEVSATDGSWYLAGTERVLYVNPYNNLEDIYTNWVSALRLDDASHIVLDGLKLYGGNGNDGVLRLCKTDSGDKDITEVTVRNLEIAFGTYTGIYASGHSTSNILIENCTIHDVPSGTYTIQAAGISHSDWTMRRVEVYSGGMRNWVFAEGFDSHALGGQALRNWLVEYCYIHDWHGDGILDYAGSSIYDDNVTIRYNRIDNLNDSGFVNHHFGIALHGTNAPNWAARNANWQIYGNVISNLETGKAGDYRGEGAAIRIKGPGGTSDQMPKIYNNLIYNCRQGLYWSGFSQDPGGSFQFKNNIIISPKSGGYQVHLGAIADATSIIITNNIWYPDTSDGNNNFFWNNKLAVNYTDFTAKAAKDGAIIEKNILSDPLLVDTSANNFHLKAGSPAIDAGVNVGLTKDFEGNPIVGAPDIGAYEYQG